MDQIRAAHPNLTDNGVRAAIAFEAEVLGVRRCLSCGRRPGPTSKRFWCTQNNRVLLTAIKDFGDLVVRQRLLHSEFARAPRWCEFRC